MQKVRLIRKVHSYFRKVSKLERELALESDKAERSQRELISSQREKRGLEEDKQGLETELARSQVKAPNRSAVVKLTIWHFPCLKNELKRLQGECDSVKKKNTSNLQQTQEGIKAFKEQVLKRGPHCVYRLMRLRMTHPVRSRASRARSRMRSPDTKRPRGSWRWPEERHWQTRRQWIPG